MRSFGIAAAAAAAAVALAGCGAAGGCQKELASVDTMPAACPALQAGATISFALHFCATCPQTDPSCVPVYDIPGVIQLEPYVAVCDPKATDCPVASSCNLSCQFQAPATPGDYQVVVIDATGNQRSVPITVAPSGAASCS